MVQPELSDACLQLKNSGLILDEHVVNGHETIVLLLRWLDNGQSACENISMLLSIELPERLVDALESRARKTHSSVQELAIQAIEKDLARIECEDGAGPRVQLPLVRSANPGSLRSLTNAAIDGILGD